MAFRSMPGDEIITNLKENDQLGWTFVSEDEAVEGVRFRQVLCSDCYSGQFQLNHC